MSKVFYRRNDNFTFMDHSLWRSVRFLLSWDLGRVRVDDGVPRVVAEEEAAEIAGADGEDELAGGKLALVSACA